MSDDMLTTRYLFRYPGNNSEQPDNNKISLTPPWHLYKINKEDCQLTQVFTVVTFIKNIPKFILALTKCAQSIHI